MEQEEFNDQENTMKNILGMVVDMARALQIEPMIFCAEIDYMNLVNRRNFSKLLKPGADPKMVWDKLHEVNLSRYEHNEKKNTYRGVKI